MPLFAKDGNRFISAWDAPRHETYRCIECNSPVKMRRGLSRVPHFYHLRTTPSCRLYSKSEDHLLLQLQLKNLLPAKEAELEHPFPSINRVADVLWEKEKLVFEIQCSSITEVEVKSRIEEYEKNGYQIVWILDDRIFNKRILRPSEQFLRSRQTYFASLNRRGTSEFYDQFELLANRNRIKKGPRLRIHPAKIRRLSTHLSSSERWPDQVNHRAAQSQKYFLGDIIYRALMAVHSFSHAIVLQNWKSLEKMPRESEKISSRLGALFRWLIRDPYFRIFHYLLDRSP